ncbi:MAG: fibrillarin-like rRNA/tRNA 2'-O-methyltransferase [Candidatus Hydrothermarchaeaceae archaeon]
MKKLFEGIYSIDDAIATKNLVEGENVYGEKLIQEGGDEYRLWNPRRSKLAAAILNGLEELPMKRDSCILYLGAASGTTASHVSDIACDGAVYCVEFSQRPFRGLLETSAKRRNMIPILADAREPEGYLNLLESCDVIYQDVAQVEQAQILSDNAHRYLKGSGHIIIAIKARSIDFSKRPEDVIAAEISRLKKRFKITEVVSLEPYEKDHSLVVGSYRTSLRKRSMAFEERSDENV